jgi:hypothetical protein
MAIYHASFRISDPSVLRPGTAVPMLMFDIRTGPTDRARLIEIHGLSANLSSADTAQSYGCGRNGSLGTALANGITFIPEDPASYATAGGLSIGLGWSSTPTVLTSYLRRWAPSQTNSTNINLVFRPKVPLVLAPSTSFGMYLISWTAGVGSGMPNFEWNVTVDI